SERCGSPPAGGIGGSDRRGNRSPFEPGGGGIGGRPAGMSGHGFEGGFGLERSWRLLWEELVRWNPELTVDEWWAGEDRFFRCLGSVLVQRNTWHNARRAIEALKGRGLTTPDAVLQGSEEELMAAI